MEYSVLVIFFIAIYLVINTYFILVDKNEIDANVKDELSFVHISDIHGTIKFINGRLSSIINKLSPDFVVVTGDLSNNNKQLLKVLNELSNLKAKNGVIVVLGNYEREERKGLHKQERDIDFIINTIQETKNIKLLQNQHCFMNIRNSKVLIYGFDNSTYGLERYSTDVENLDNDYKIILAHSPNIIKVVERDGVSFNQILVGHTHGGQINIYGNKHLGIYKDFHVGIKKYKHGLFCISRGLGTVKIPFRINCFPEISLYIIKPAEKSMSSDK